MLDEAYLDVHLDLTARRELIQQLLGPLGEAVVEEAGGEGVAPGLKDAGDGGHEGGLVRVQLLQLRPEHRPFELDRDWVADDVRQGCDGLLHGRVGGVVVVADVDADFGWAGRC